MGAQAANKIISQVAEQFASEIARRLPRQALTRTAYYPLIKQIGKWIELTSPKTPLRVACQNSCQLLADLFPLA